MPKELYIIKNSKNKNIIKYILDKFNFKIYSSSRKEKIYKNMNSCISIKKDFIFYKIKSDDDNIISNIELYFYKEI